MNTKQRFPLNQFSGRTIKKDRRKMDRIDWFSSVSVVSLRGEGDSPVIGQMRDLGIKGFSFASREPLMIGEKYRFRMDLMDRTATPQGKITHVRKTGEGHQIGVHIEAMKAGERMQINRIVALQSKKEKRIFFFYSLGGGMATLLLAFFAAGAPLPISLTIGLIAALLLYIFLPF